MKLPYREKASVAEEKLTEYLLSETHPIGSSKAKFFRKHGFNEKNVEILTKLLLKIASDNEIRDVKTLIYGINYVIEGIIDTPAGRTIKVMTVWFIPTGKRKPSFVTAYPV